MKRVYFLKPIGMAGPIKIGCSILPEGRLQALDIWSPFPLELIAVAPGEHRDEKRLHWRFRKDHSHGEWFFASPGLLSLIDHVRLNGTLPPLEAVPRNCSGRRQRNQGWKAQKTLLTARLGRAEKQAFGTRYGAPRPERIKELIASYQGAHTPPPSPETTAEIEAHIEALLARPACRLSWEQVRASMAIWQVAQRFAA